MSTIIVPRPLVKNVYEILTAVATIIPVELNTLMTKRHDYPYMHL